MARRISPHEKHGALDSFQRLFGVEVLAQVAIDRGAREVGVVLGQELIAGPHVEREEWGVIRLIGTNRPVQPVQKEDDLQDKGRDSQQF